MLEIGIRDSSVFALKNLECSFSQLKDNAFCYFLVTTMCLLRKEFFKTRAIYIRSVVEMVVEIVMWEAQIKQEV